MVHNLLIKARAQYAYRKMKNIYMYTIGKKN